jgi:lysophospholipase L1-like esterase
MKKVKLLLAFVFGFGTLAGCSVQSRIPPKNEETTQPEIKKPFYEKVKMLGRTYEEKGVVWCGYSGTGIEFSFVGTKCTIVLGGDFVSLTASENNYARVAIYVDGKRIVDEMMNEKEKRFTVVDSETEQSSVIRVIKLSECMFSGFSIQDIQAEGEIFPTDNKDVVIEFIGDSITCGYGVDDENPYGNFSTKTEDITRTYAYKTAEALNADYSIVAISGYGIISGYTTADTPNITQTLPEYYDKLGYSLFTYGAHKPQYIDWNFAKCQPDIIIINLGTNDNSYVKGNEERALEFKNGYVSFLKQIRKNNPNATVVCTLGMMGDELYEQIELAVLEYSNECNDKKMYTMKFDVQSEQDGYAIDWHPSERTHQNAADKLVAYLKDILS